MKKIMLLGSGELGRELTISLKRLGCTVYAVDSYDNAPAMQVADKAIRCDMLNDNMLYHVIDFYKPDIIVPEIEAIDTQTLIKCEQEGYHVVPSANAVDKTMNRDRIRDFAAEQGLLTAKYKYAEDLDDFINVCQEFNKNGFTKLVVKPVMSSSGKGQSIIHTDNMDEILLAWDNAENGRGDRQTVIVEEFIDFDFEITLLTIRQDDPIRQGDSTYFCNPIIHIQEDGDFKFSQQFESNNFWQLHPSNQLIQNDTIAKIINDAQTQAAMITKALTGNGLFGVEFFVTGDKVLFSELSPRPHDTGLVTLKSQNYSEFDLHARAFLGLPIPDIKTIQSHQVHTINASKRSDSYTVNVDRVKSDVDIHLFNKPNTRPGRRLGVVFSNDPQAGRNAINNIEIKYQE